MRTCIRLGIAMFVMLVGIVSAGFGQDASITVGGWNFTINLAGWRASDNIEVVCSKEHLEKFLNKVCVFDLTYMDRSITGRVKEVGKDFLLLEMRDAKVLCGQG